MTSFGLKFILMSVIIYILFSLFQPIASVNGAARGTDFILRNPPLRECSDHPFDFNSTSANYHFVGETGYGGVPSMNASDGGRIMTMDINNYGAPGPLSGSLFVPVDNGSGYVSFDINSIETTCFDDNERQNQSRIDLGAANLNPPFKACNTEGNLTRVLYQIKGTTPYYATGVLAPESPQGGRFEMYINNDFVTGRISGGINLPGGGSIPFDDVQFSTSCTYTTLTG